MPGIHNYRPRPAFFQGPPGGAGARCALLRDLQGRGQGVRFRLRRGLERHPPGRDRREAPRAASVAALSGRGISSASHNLAFSGSLETVPESPGYVTRAACSLSIGEAPALDGLCGARPGGLGELGERLGLLASHLKGARVLAGPHLAGAACVVLAARGFIVILTEPGSPADP